MTAFIFPGQGSQYVGMGKDFYDAYLAAREVFQEADEILGENLSKLIFEGPLDKLTETRNSQIAIFVVSCAIYKVLKEQFPDLKPVVCAGLSLGEYTAAFVSGRLSFKQALLLVKKRAELMNVACERTKGTMAAVLGMDAESIAKAVAPLEGVSVANYNAPGQTVISGTISGVERATIVLKEAGAKRVIPLTVHGAFHSKLMQSAREGLAPFIENADFQKSDIEFVMNVSGSYVSDLLDVKKNMIAQVTESVRWEQSIVAMKAKGIERFIEIGCGKTLAGLNRKMGAVTVSVDKVADLETVYATV